MRDNKDISIMTVTPSMAAAWLSDSDGVNYRIRSKRVVDRYAHAMRTGSWDFNGESIKLDRDGRVVDGQHRLAACVDAQVTFKTVVVNGVESADNIDCGYKRSIGNVLTFHGYKNAVALGAAASVCLNHEKGLRNARMMRPSLQPRDLVVKWITENPRIIDSVAAGSGIRTLKSPACMSVLHFLLWKQNDSKEAIDRFMAMCETGIGERGDPTVTFHQRIVRDAGETSSNEYRFMIIVYGIKAWNAYATGQKIEKIQGFRTVEANSKNDLPEIKRLP